MRRAGLVVLIAAASLVTIGATAAPDRRSGLSVVARAGLTIRLSAGLHRVSGKLTDLIDPNLRLAVASFPVKSGSHPCVCDTPNVYPFPRAGGLLFVWERLDPIPRGLRRWYPRRPRRFRLTSVTPQRSECQGPSAEILFRDHGRALSADFYLGPTATGATRERLLATLDSLRVAREPADLRSRP